MYYHVSTILMRVALGTISKFHIYFYILYDIIFILREMREMFKFVKVATLALAFVAGIQDKLMLFPWLKCTRYYIHTR